MELIERIKNDLKENLTEYRYIHSLGVMEMAEELATIYNVDVESTRLAGLLHDIAKEMTEEERADGDRDQWLIRMTSKVAEKDLTDFYEAHGIVANATTLK